jgi:hypothetical protein
MENFSFGAIESKSDNKRIFHEELTTMANPEPALTGGVSYQPDEIEHQHKVGICTAISLTQNAQKAIGRKFSADFQYLLQKKYYDGGWFEGSSILNALKVGTKFGFLPLEEWTWTTENDRLLPYDAYIAKLKAIPDTEIQRLINLCSDYKLTGYAQIDQNVPNALSNAIKASRSGILCMYVVDEQWWTPSWNAKDINPLRPPKTNLSGHAINMESFDYTKGFDQVLANTWSPAWCRQGKADINWSNYKPREAWIPYFYLTETQLNELKNTLKSKITLLQKIVELLTKLKTLVNGNKTM